MKHAMKLIISIIIFFIPFYLEAQTGILQTRDVQDENQITVKREITTKCVGGTSLLYTYEGPYEVGYSSTWYYESSQLCQDNKQIEYRSGFKFILPIPGNGILKSAKVRNTSTYEGTLVSLPVNSHEMNATDFFEAVGNGGSISDMPNTDWVDITSYASQFLSYGYFCIGALSGNSPGLIAVQCVIEWEIPAHITFQNNMGGQLNVNGSDYTSSYSNDYWLGTNITLSVNEPQSASGFTWIWNDSEAPTYKSEWNKVKNGTASFKSNDLSYSFSVVADDHSSTYLAIMRKICNITFQNNFVSVGNGGIINVNGQSYSSPTTQFQVVDQNAITASTQGQGLNGIAYTFTQWSDGNPYSYRTFYPSAHSTYTANFIGKPSNYGEYVNFGSDVGQPIVIYWTDNINSNVTQYQIWRRVKHNGVVGPETHLGTVGSGVQTFTDYDYLLTSTYSDDLLWYDVRAYYSTEGTYSDPQWSAVYGEMSFSERNEPIIALEISNELPTQYRIDNYPNPFNPTTTINYQLPEGGFVTIKVFDILGKEVALLVNENKSAGYYKVNFNGSNLTSGVYIYTIQVNGITQSKKMLLAK